MALPEFYVESDGKLYAYWRKDILRADLALHKHNREPAVRVFAAVHDNTIPVAYGSTHEFDQWLAPGIENYCDKHKRERLPRPVLSFCQDCENEMKEQLGHDVSTSDLPN